MKDILYKGFHYGLILLMLVSIQACDSFIVITPTLPLPEYTHTPSDTPTPTQTIEWFPPTATPTLLPASKTPTPTMAIGPGERNVVLIDNFDREKAWETYRSDIGSAALGKEELTLAIAAPKGYLTSFRYGPFPANYFLEIIANPSLCRGEDSYGLLLRGIDKFNYYRLGITCNGQVKFEWVKDGKGIPLIEPVSGKTLIIGPPGKNKIAVWAVNKEFRIFINDVYQFSVYGLVQLEGSFGVFARSAGENAVTINYSNLTVYEGSQMPPTPTSIPTPIPSSTPTIRTP